MGEKNFDLEEKDIYKLFNEIKIEESEFEDMDVEVLPIQKETIKKALNKKIKTENNFKRVKYGATAAAIGLACLVGIGTVSPTFAQNIPILSSIIQSINESHGDHGEYENYSQLVNKSATDKGVTLTINEALADDSKLIIGYTVKSDKKIKDKFYGHLMSDLRIDGKRWNGGSGASGKFVDEYTYILSDEYDIKNLNLKENINIDLKVNEIGEVKGKWDFAFSISKEEIAKKSTIFKPNNRIDFPDSNVSIDEVGFSPIGTYISISGNYKGNKSVEARGIMEYDYWLAFDDKGVELTPKGLGSGSSHKSNFNSKMEYTKVKNIPKYLTIVPCKITPSGGGGATEDGKVTTYKNKAEEEISKTIDGAYPIELSQGEFGKIIVKEIKTENNKTIVNYTAEGKAPYFQGANLYIKDSSGNRVKSKSRDIRKNEEKPNEFTMEFEGLVDNQQYKICTTNLENIEFGEELKFKIELVN